MAGITTLLGRDIDLYVGSTIVGCADEIGLDITADMLSTLCAGSGDIKTSVPGRMSIKASLKGLAKVYSSAEESANVGYFDQIDAIIARTLVTMSFKTKTVGDRIIVITAYTSSFKMTSSATDNSKYDCSFDVQSITTNTTVSA
jgi:hypothetical protein